MTFAQEIVSDAAASSIDVVDDSTISVCCSSLILNLFGLSWLILLNIGLNAKLVTGLD